MTLLQHCSTTTETIEHFNTPKDHPSEPELSHSNLTSQPSQPDNTKNTTQQCNETIQPQHTNQTIQLENINNNSQQFCETNQLEFVHINNFKNKNMYS